MDNSVITIVMVTILVAYLLYNQQNNQMQINNYPQTRQQRQQPHREQQFQQQQPTHITIDSPRDPYSDPIKSQDMYSMYDPLSYPQQRLPRDVLEKYNSYYDQTGSYPPFNQATQPLFDNPILNGILIKHCDSEDPFHDQNPTTVPLFRVKSAKNTNRFFYYIVDQRYVGKMDLKVPLDFVKINDVSFSNSDFYGLPEIFDGDFITEIPIYPGSTYKVMLYKTFHFP